MLVRADLRGVVRRARRRRRLLPAPRRAHGGIASGDHLAEDRLHPEHSAANEDAAPSRVSGAPRLARARRHRGNRLSRRGVAMPDNGVLLALRGDVFRARQPSRDLGEPRSLQILPAILHDAQVDKPEALERPTGCLGYSQYSRTLASRTTAHARRETSNCSRWRTPRRPQTRGLSSWEIGHPRRPVIRLEASRSWPITPIRRRTRRARSAWRVAHGAGEGPAEPGNRHRPGRAATASRWRLPGERADSNGAVGACRGRLVTCRCAHGGV